MIEFCNHHRNEEEMKYISEVGKPVLTHVTNNIPLNKRARDEELYGAYERMLIIPIIISMLFATVTLLAYFFFCKKNIVLWIERVWIILVLAMAIYNCVRVSKRDSIKKNHGIFDEIYLQVSGATINFMYCDFIINYINQLEIINENQVVACLTNLISCGLTIGVTKLISSVFSAKNGLKYDVATVVFTDNRKRVFKDVERYIVKSSSIVIFSKQDGRDSMIEIQKASIKYIEVYRNNNQRMNA